MSTLKPPIDAAPTDLTKEAPVEHMHVKTAGLFERLLAAMADLLVPLALGIGTYVAWSKPEVMVDSEWNAIDRFVDGYNTDIWLLWAPLAAVGLGAFAWKAWYGLRGVDTPGRRLCKLSLVSRRGTSPNAHEVFLHGAAWFFGMLLLMLGPLWMLADPEKRTLHDRIAGLYLVKRHSVPSAVAEVPVSASKPVLTEPREAQDPTA